jgi:hypothetical protein
VDNEQAIIVPPTATEAAEAYIRQLPDTLKKEETETSDQRQKAFTLGSDTPKPDQPQPDQRLVSI